MNALKFDTSKQKLWFVSDIHYHHNKPFILGPRGYNNIEQAKADLRVQWTKHIGPDDVVINLGDVIVGAGDQTKAALYDFLSLPCKHQYFVWGNHNAGVNDLYADKIKSIGGEPVTEVYPLTIEEHNFTYIGHYAEMVVDGRHVILCHYPIMSWDRLGRGAYMIHGHCHRNMADDKNLRRLDVGWEWKGRPVEWSEIDAELRNRKSVSPDHHGKEDV